MKKSEAPGTMLREDKQKEIIAEVIWPCDTYSSSGSNGSGSSMTCDYVITALMGNLVEF